MQARFWEEDLKNELWFCYSPYDNMSYRKTNGIWEMLSAMEAPVTPHVMSEVP